MEKKEIRQQVRAMQKEYSSADYRTQTSDKVLEQVENDQDFLKAKVVLLYLAIDGEVEDHFFVDKWSKHKTVLLPVVKGDRLILRRYTSRKDLLVGAFGVMEPTGEEYSNLQDIDYALIPGMAFDKNNHRMGRGKGYYDRLLPNLTRAKLVGLCYPFQMFEEIPTDSHDVDMDLVVY